MQVLRVFEHCDAVIDVLHMLKGHKNFAYARLVGSVYKKWKTVAVKLFPVSVPLMYMLILVAGICYHWWWTPVIASLTRVNVLAGTGNQHLLVVTSDSVVNRCCLHTL